MAHNYVQHKTTFHPAENWSAVTQRLFCTADGFSKSGRCDSVPSLTLGAHVTAAWPDATKSTQCACAASVRACATSRLFVFLIRQVGCRQRDRLNKEKKATHAGDCQRCPTATACGPVSQPSTIKPRKQESCPKSAKAKKRTNVVKIQYYDKKRKPAARKCGRRKKPRNNNTNQTFRRRCRNQVLRFTLSVVLSPLFAFFFSSKQECTRAVRHTQKHRQDEKTLNLVS